MALAKAGHRRRPGAHRAVARLDDRLDERGRPAQARGLRRRAAGSRGLRAARCSASSRSPARDAARAIPKSSPNSARPPARRCGAAGLPRTLRLFQMPLTMAAPRSPALSPPDDQRCSPRDRRRHVDRRSRSAGARPRLRLRAGPISDPAHRSSTARRCGAPTRSARARMTASCASRSRRWMAARSRPGRRRLKAGDEIEVMTPTGRFGIAPAPEQAHPCRLRRRLGHHADPVDRAGRAGARAGQPVLPVLRQPLDRRYPVPRGAGGAEGPLHQRLSLFHVLSREEQDLPVLNGRLDGEKARLLLRSLVPAASVDHVFICGPSGMSEDVETTCREIGVAPSASMSSALCPELGGGRVRKRSCRRRAGESDRRR